MQKCLPHNADQRLERVLFLHRDSAWRRADSQAATRHGEPVQSTSTSTDERGRRMPALRMLPLALGVLVVACGGGERRSTAAADTVTARAHATAVLAPLAPVRALSTAEADYAANAAQRASRDDVRRYAQVVATDHRAVAGILDSVARAEGVGYETTPAARELETTVRTAHGGRDSLTGITFDLAYIRAEVEAQRQLIDRLDQELIPGMGAAPQKVVLQNVRAMANAHLTRARQLLAVILREAPAAVAVARPAAAGAGRAAPSRAAGDSARRPPPDTGRARPDTTRPRPRPDTTHAAARL
jgi:predicted outer membrane protein